MLFHTMSEGDFHGRRALPCYPHRWHWHPSAKALRAVVTALYVGTHQQLIYLPWGSVLCFGTGKSKGVPSCVLDWQQQLRDIPGGQNLYLMQCENHSQRFVHWIGVRTP